MLKRPFSLSLAACLLLTAFLSCFSCAASAAAVPAPETAGAQDDPFHGIVPLSGELYAPFSHDYYHGVWEKASPVEAYLVQNADSTLTGVETVWDYGDEFHPEQILYILAETYSSDGRELISTKRIPMELQRFGGFFSGAKYNFLVFGKGN